MELLSTSVKEVDTSLVDKPYCFELYTTGKAYFVAVESAEEVTAWIHAIKSVSTSLIRASIGYSLSGRPPGTHYQLSTASNIRNSVCIMRARL